MHESAATKTKRFLLFTEESCFTDDTVLTVAVAKALLSGDDYTPHFTVTFADTPTLDMGSSFASGRNVVVLNRTTVGNGSRCALARLVSHLTKSRTFCRSRALCECDAQSPRGYSRRAVAACVFLARHGANKAEIQDYVERTFGYRLDQPLKQIRPKFLFDVSCAGTVPPAIRSFLESNDFEDALRNAISLGGDADTLASIAGAIAEAFYGGVPSDIEAEALSRLDNRLLRVVKSFRKKFSLRPKERD